MANNLYYNYANLMLGNGSHTLPDMDTHTIKACLIDHTDVTPDVTTHQDLDDIDAPTVVATSGAMTGASISNGAIDFADFAFTAVTGDAADSLNFYYDSTVASTSPLIAYFDTATGLPVTPNGADINVALNASGLYKLVV